MVVVLHIAAARPRGGLQLHGAGWSTLAKALNGFAPLHFPSSSGSNNPNSCFNWFEPGDTRRDGGEAASIRAMVDRMVRDHGIDRDRVFITGLSASGAIDVGDAGLLSGGMFAGGAIIAGLPYSAAGNVQQAFESMFPMSVARPAREWEAIWSAARRRATTGRGRAFRSGTAAAITPWWHRTRAEILKQWTDVHGLAAAPSAESQVDGYPREVGLNQGGDEVIDSTHHHRYGARHAARDWARRRHGMRRAGTVRPLEIVGTSSTYHIAKFFGLTRGRCPRRGSGPERRRRGADVGRGSRGPSPEYCTR